MPLPYPINPNLRNVPVYQPGRPIEEVARELGLPWLTHISSSSLRTRILSARPATAVAAMRKALTQSNLYPDGNAFYLKQKLAAKLGVTPAHVILGNGSNEIIEFIGHAVIAPGAQVIVSQYCFAVYPIVTALFGGRLTIVPAKNYGHDLDAMLAAITPETRIIFVANPNNPTGTSVTREELAAFIAAVPENIVIALDEAYIEFLENPLDLVSDIRDGKKPNLLLMRTFSKIYGLAGLRLGYGIANPELIAELEKVRQPFNINAISQAGALAALDDIAHAEKTRKFNARGLKFYARALRKLKETRVHSFVREFHPRARRRRRDGVSGIAKGGRHRAANGRLRIAGVDPHFRRHTEAKCPLSGSADKSTGDFASTTGDAMRFLVARSSAPALPCWRNGAPHGILFRNPRHHENRHRLRPRRLRI